MKTSEIKWTGSKFIDSSIWIDFFLYGKFRDIIESDGGCYCSVISLYEVNKGLIRNKVKPRLRLRYLIAIQLRAIIVPILVKDSLDAINNSLMYNLALADMFIFTCAQAVNTQLITRDNDFRNLPNVVVLE